jgi:hypothetical protein
LWTAEYDYVRLINNKGERVTFKLDADEIDDAEDPQVPEEAASELDEGEIWKFYVDEDGYVVDIDLPADTGTFTAGDVDAFSAKNDTITVGGAVYYVTSSTVFFDFTASKTSDWTVIDWADIEDSEKVGDLEGSFGFDAKGKLNYVVFEDGLGNLGADDVYVAFVLDMYKVTSTRYDLDMQLLGGDEETVRVHKDDLSGAAKEVAVLYTLNSDGTGVVEASWDAWYDMEPLADYDGDYGYGFEECDEVDDDYIKLDGAWFKVASDALIYEVVYDGAEVDDYEEADLNDIDTGDDVSFFTIDGVIQLLFFTK